MTLAKDRLDNKHVKLSNRVRCRTKQKEITQIGLLDIDVVQMRPGVDPNRKLTSMQSTDYHCHPAKFHGLNNKQTGEYFYWKELWNRLI
jgi:hypothetical protein